MEKLEYTEDELFAVLDTVGIEKKDNIFETLSLGVLDTSETIQKIQGLGEREKYIVLSAIVDKNDDNDFKDHIEFLRPFKDELIQLRYIS